MPPPEDFGTLILPGLATFAGLALKPESFAGAFDAFKGVNP
jgi:hypothetical protein